MTAPTTKRGGQVPSRSGIHSITHSDSDSTHILQSSVSQPLLENKNMLIRDKLRSEQWSLAVSVLSFLLNVFRSLCLPFFAVLLFNFAFPLFFLFFSHFRDSFLSFWLCCCSFSHLVLVFGWTTWRVVFAFFSNRLSCYLSRALENCHFGELLQVLSFFFNTVYVF